MDIDFTRLRYFVAVAEELHFKRAADRLMITPPPLSKQIRLLEQELGGALFDRDYHEVRLTPLGEAMLDPARDILDRVDAFKALAAQSTNTTSALRIGATAYATTQLIERLEAAIAELPIAAVLRVGSSAVEVTAALVAGQLDLGVIHIPAPDDRVDFRPIWETPGAIAIRSDDPLAGRETIRLEELQDRKVVIDFARANPVILADQARKLAARGVTQLVHAASGRGGEVEMAAQIYNRRLVAVIANAPDSFLSRMFAPPQFTIVPIEVDSLPPAQVALAWLPERLRRQPQLATIIDEIAERVTLVPQPA